MDNHGQGVLRSAIITGGLAAIGIYVISRRRNAAQDETTGAVNSAVDTLHATEIGKRSTRLGELILGNVTDDAMRQVKALLRDALHGMEAAVDEL